MSSSATNRDSPGQQPAPLKDMIWIPGGTFQMVSVPLGHDVERAR
jgi:hypothetical protein